MQIAVKLQADRYTISLLMLILVSKEPVCCQ